MFNIELIQLIIKNKEELLNKAQNASPINQNDIDILKQEIEYLKVLVTRYEIAKILKLDKNQDYMADDFLGIEEENINDFNLTQDEINQYNTLIAKIPSEQLQKHKIRKEMANILGEDKSAEFKKNNYVGIENINPVLTKYNLTQDQINSFNSLITKINGLPKDTTTKVNIGEELLRIARETINQLNIDDINQYKNIKDSCLDTLDKIMHTLGDDDRKTLFTGLSNYQLVADLSKLYPNIPIKLDLKGVEKLLDVLNSSSLMDYEYDDFIDLLCDNIKELYADDANKSVIENLLNNLGNNYLLRNDLSDKLSSINNVNLKLNDKEFADVFHYLDEHFDSLDAREISKYYGIIEAKIKEGMNDLDKIDEINDLISNVKNKSLAKRLQHTFSEVGNIKFANHHDLSYNSLIQDKINKLEKLKKKYTDKNTKMGIVGSFYETRIAEIDKEINRLNDLKNENNNNNALIRLLDSRYSKKTDKTIQLEKEIKELKNLKEQATSRFAKNMIDRKIAYRNKKIKKLMNSKVKIDGWQKKIMTPKLWLKRKRGMIKRHFESKTEVFNNFSNDFRQMAEKERQFNGMFSGIKAAFYEFKAMMYDNKSKFNKKIFDILNSGKVKLQGGNKKTINKNTLNTIRQNQQRTAVNTV